MQAAVKTTEEEEEEEEVRTTANSVLRHARKRVE